MNISDLLKQASRLDVHQASYFPIFRVYMQRLALVELINQMIGGPVTIKPGLIVTGMIQDTLSGRTPLCHLEQFFEDQDIELMLGESVPVSVFADHNVGRVLDRIVEIGASKIFGEIARRAAVIFDLDTRCGYWDSTSVSLWGEYDESFPENTLKITYGYSKDHRPDLKQFMLSMLCVEHNIPILGETHDGNSSDKTLNNKLLTRISKDLVQNGLGEGAFTYVADSAMVTEANLVCFDPIPGAAPLCFVTRPPHIYSQADAECAALRSLSTPLHAMESRIEEQVIYAAGRPRKDGVRPIAKRQWRVLADVIERTEAIEQKRTEVGCFILITNRPAEGTDAQKAEELLRTYKAQDGIERNFSFLKDPLVVNNVFLKKPQRIEALGLVLLLSLLIWNLIQRQMRIYLDKTKSTTEGLDRRKTNRPTSYVLTTKFRYVQIMRFGNMRMLKKPLKPVQLAYLQALGLTEDIFTSSLPPPFSEKSTR